MQITTALRIKNNIILAAVGAGGKSSFLFALARQLPGKVILTTTTHLAIEQIKLADFHFLDNDDLLLQKINTCPVDALIILTGADYQRERINGPATAILDQVHQECVKKGYSLLIEADGSRKLPLKAHAEHEPVIPGWVETVVHVVGCSAIGQPNNAENVFRVARLTTLSGIEEGEAITMEGICKILNHPEGGLKAMPAHSQSIIYFNQIDQLVPHQLEELQTHIPKLLEHHNKVLLGMMNLVSPDKNKITSCHERITAVILAAGESKRFGFPKQLLQVNGVSFLRHTTLKAIESGLNPIIVILGYEYESMLKELSDLPVEIINNRDWEKGQSTSVKTAVSRLCEQEGRGGALFLTIDQPFLTKETMQSIVRCHTSNIGATIVPNCDGRAGSPVLFDAAHFDLLKQISGDKGGRAILNKVRNVAFEIKNCQELMDIDTLEEYQRYFPEEFLPI